MVRLRVRARLATVVLAAVLLGMAGCGTTTIVRTVQAPSTTTTGSTSTTTSAPAVLKVGDSATLTGNAAGEKLRVTVLGYMSSVSGSTIDTPSTGNQYAGVSVSLANVGTVPYNDSPSNGSSIVTADGRRGKTTILSEGPCSGPFPSDVKIAQAASEQGCIPFEVPTDSPEPNVAPFPGVRVRLVG